MRVIGLAQIRAALDEDAALCAIETAFRRFHAQQAQVTSVGHLKFSEPPGDCHVKSAAFVGDAVFVVKVATGFYRNPLIGKAAGNGFMAVISATTGEVLGVLHDEGHLTDLRTGMAGAIAARAIARSGATTLGIVGAGVQARLQARLISRVLNVKSVLVWARNGPRATELATELGAQAVELKTLCEQSDLIVTTTPSTQPLLLHDMIRPGTRIVAVGADAPGKRELDSRLVARARVVVDSREQCLDHGEAGWAVRDGLLAADSLIELGALLTVPISFTAEEIVIADLTGVAIQDVAIASSVWSRIGASDEA